jgi:ribonuclease kappa
VVVSIFAIVILSVLGFLFRANHHELVGGTEDPENGPEVAGTIFVAVLVYAVRGLPHFGPFLSPKANATAT